MFPSKDDIAFFYNLGFYTEADLDFYVELGYLDELQKNEIMNGE